MLNVLDERKFRIELIHIAWRDLIHSQFDRWLISTSSNNTHHTHTDARKKHILCCDNQWSKYSYFSACNCDLSGDGRLKIALIGDLSMNWMAFWMSFCLCHRRHHRCCLCVSLLLRMWTTTKATTLISSEMITFRLRIIYKGQEMGRGSFVIELMILRWIV